MTDPHYINALEYASAHYTYITQQNWCILIRLLKPSHKSKGFDAHVKPAY